MRHNLVQIEDSKGQMFHIEVWTPGFSERRLIPFIGWRKGRLAGYWKVINLGFIKYTEGDALRIESDAWVNASASLMIGLPLEQGQEQWGIRLDQYDNSFGTKNIGTGELSPVWASGAAPGMIRWRRPNENEMVAADVKNANRRGGAR